MTGKIPHPTIDTDMPVNVTLFSSPGMAGTTATVRLYSADPGGETISRLAADDGAPASCFAWTSDDLLQVRCFKGPHPIDFCGHGLLATAAVAHRAGIPVSIIASGKSRHHLMIDREERLWLESPRIPCRADSSRPDGWFDTPPCSGSTAGGERGYWIFRWPRGFELAKLEPDLERIGRETRRAIIVTTAIDAGGREVAMRYFAPQYGNDEDAVTGSAATVLGDYWQQPTLTVWQQSPAGGRIEVAVADDSVGITGNIEF